MWILWRRGYRIYRKQKTPCASLPLAALCSLWPCDPTQVFFKVTEVLWVNLFIPLGLSFLLWTIRSLGGRQCSSEYDWYLCRQPKLESYRLLMWNADSWAWVITAPCEGGVVFFLWRMKLKIRETSLLHWERGRAGIWACFRWFNFNACSNTFGANKTGEQTGADPACSWELTS